MTGQSVTRLFRGLVSDVQAPDGKPLTSGIRKQDSLKVVVKHTGVVGDASARPDHGTTDRALHIFSCEGYQAVEARLQRPLPRPAFGENILAKGLTEKRVCVGDVYRIGNEVTIRVTQPTERCNVIGRNLGIPKLLKTLHELKVFGFYASVIEEGEISTGAQIELCERPQEQWPLIRLHDAMFSRIATEESDAALEIRELSAEWKDRLLIMRGRVQRGVPPSSMLIECGVSYKVAPERRRA